MEPYQTSLAGTSISFNVIGRSFRFIHKIRIKDIELVSLYNLRWRIVMIIVRLIVFIPFITRVDTIEILRFSWAVLIMPPIHLPEDKITL